MSETEIVNYCKDAKKLFGIKILCSKDCPMYKTCPWIVLGDSADQNAKKIMREMIKRANEKIQNNKSKMV